MSDRPHAWLTPLRESIRIAEAARSRNIVLPIPTARRIDERATKLAVDADRERRVRTDSATGRKPRGNERGVLSLQVRLDQDAGLVVDEFYCRVDGARNQEANTRIIRFIEDLRALLEDPADG